MKRILILLFAVLLLVPVAIYYRNFYSVDSLASIQCSFHHLTGWQCSGCGGQRAFHYLLHGEILTALRNNMLFVIGLPFLLYLYYAIVEIYILKNEKISTNSVFTSRFGIVFVIILLSFFIIRNIPFSPFIYLSPPA